MNLNFSENFKQLRKEKGVTQEKIAEILGVTGQTVSRWELSICYPDLELLPSIANYFGVTVDSLLSNDNNSKQKDREIFYEKIKTLDFLFFNEYNDKKMRVVNKNGKENLCHFRLWR